MCVASLCARAAFSPCHIVLGWLVREIVFFFKQKTAYEIGQCLEFRRVLFRSRLAKGGWAFLGAELPKNLPQHAKQEFGIGGRSEERRVGKEGRCRWARGREKKRRDSGMRR